MTLRVHGPYTHVAVPPGLNADLNGALDIVVVKKCPCNLAAAAVVVSCRDVVDKFTFSSLRQIHANEDSCMWQKCSLQERSCKEHEMPLMFLE